MALGESGAPSRSLKSRSSSCSLPAPSRMRSSSCALRWSRSTSTSTPQFLEQFSRCLTWGDDPERDGTIDLPRAEITGATEQRIWQLAIDHVTRQLAPYRHRITARCTDELRRATLSRVCEIICRPLRLNRYSNREG